MVGILSLIFGIVGILTSFFYVGIFLCIVGITLGIVGLTDCFSEKNFPLAGLLLSILGTILSIYTVVSDIDAGRLLILYLGNESESLYVDESYGDMFAENEKRSVEANRSNLREKSDEDSVTDNRSNSKDSNQTSYIEQIDLDNDETDVHEDKDEAGQNGVPSEYNSALKKAIDYSNMMCMSKAAIYDQLISEYGEKFSEDAAQYAIDNMEVDWNSNALAKAKEYSEVMYMSKAAIYDQLISDYGEKFTAEEAQYAVDNVNADWKTNALKKAEEYQEMMAMSPEAIRDQLVSEYGEKFTEEEAGYAISNLK